MRAIICFTALLATVALAACGGGGGSQQSAMPTANAPVPAPMNGSMSGNTATSANSSTKATPAFFNDQRVTIFIIALSPNAAQRVLAHNKNVNLIFEATGFLPVINEIQGPGFNPLWEVVDITFSAGTTPHQFTSQAAILAAQSGGQVTLNFTNNVDTVPVVGSGGK